MAEEVVLLVVQLAFEELAQEEELVLVLVVQEVAVELVLTPAEAWPASVAEVATAEAPQDSVVVQEERRQPSLEHLFRVLA